MPPTIDYVGELARRMPANLYGPGLAAIHARGVVSVMIRYNGLDRQVWVADDGVRPPAPGGAWLEDRLSAACRLLFGCTRGRVRPVPGLDGRLEFREAWPEPELVRVHAKPPITIRPCPRFPDGRTDSLVVQTSALVGADEASVICAHAQAYCEYKLGPGVVRWESASRLVYVPGSPAAPEVRFRHTVIRAGGQPVELVTPVSPDIAKNWPGVFAAVQANCRAKFGPGTLRYEPELGETFFTFGAAS